MTKLNANAYTFGVSVNEQGAKADSVVRTLSGFMDQAAVMAAQAKSALHEVIRYRPTYDRHSNRKRNKATLEVFAKCDNLRANYYAAAEAFAHFSKGAVASITELAGLMPGLVKGGEVYNSTDESYGRVGNAVLCSQLILGIPQELERLAEEFQIADSSEDKLHVCVGNTNLHELVRNRKSENYQARFNAILKVPFIPGTTDDKSFAALDQALVVIDAAIARGEQVLKLFSDTKARFFDGKWDAPETWAPFSQPLIDEYTGQQIDYAIMGWTGENVASEVWKASCNVEEAINVAETRLSALRYDHVLINNLVAALCKVKAARELRKSIQKAVNRWHGEQDEKTRTRKELSHNALTKSFAAIPAVHRIPNLSLLDNPTRGYGK